MANEADLKLIEIPQFPPTTTLEGSGAERIPVTKADGVTYGISTEDFKAFLGTVQVQVPKALAPTDPAPTLSGVYYPTVTQNEAGTPIVYANAGGIEVNTAEGGEDYGKQVQLIYDGTNWVKVAVPLPEPDLSDYINDSDIGISSNVWDGTYRPNTLLSTTGLASTETGAESTYVIPIPVGKTNIYLQSSAETASAKRLCFYKEDNTFASFIETTTGLNVIPIPSDGVKFAYCYKRASDSAVARNGLIISFSEITNEITAIKGVPIKNADKEIYSKYETDSLLPEITLEDSSIIGNLANPVNVVADSYMNSTSGAFINDSSAVGWVRTGYIYPPSFAEKISVNGLPTTTSKTIRIERENGTIHSVVNPAGLPQPISFNWLPDMHRFAMTIKRADETLPSQLMINVGDPIPYIPYSGDSGEVVAEINGFGIKASELKSGAKLDGKEIATVDMIPSQGGGNLNYSLSEAGLLTLTDGINQISGYIGVAGPSSENIMFNFANYSMFGASRSNPDDVAPVHIEGTTLGANHGRPYNVATITAHGLNNTHIGTAWTHSNGKTYYVIKINNANQVSFLSANEGTFETPIFVNVQVGTISRGASTLTISSVSGAQIYPSIKKLTQMVVTDSGKTISAEESGTASKVMVIESYEIMSSVSILEKLIERAGQNAPPVYDGDGICRVENVYVFNSDLSVLILNSLDPLLPVSFTDDMVTQAIPLNSSAKFYIPNSNPLNASVDLRKPVSVAWSSSIPSTFVINSEQPEPDNPPNRIIQYYNNTGFMVGYIPDIGGGSNLNTYTARTFEIRNNSGKIYPHALESTRIGAFAPIGGVYNFGMFRAYCDLSKVRTDERLSYFLVPYNGATYVFVDYSASVFDRLVLDASNLIGKRVEVIQEVNTQVLSDINTGSITVNAQYVEGETCFAVFKLI